MVDIIKSVISWVGGWDLMTIIYGVVPTVVIALVLWWTGSLKRLWGYYKTQRGLRAYRDEVREFCSTLVVIGQKRGFRTREVFIPLEIALSDLSSQEADKRSGTPNKFVLLGGPGAGKSTYVKSELLDSIQAGETPILVRLRDYVGFDSIETYIENRLKASGVPSPSVQINRLLGNPRCFCVLDGLDEVRPKEREKVSEHINAFYARYFQSKHGSRIIVTCRKEAYRALPLVLTDIYEVRPLTDQQILTFATKWPPGYPDGKSPESFCRDLSSSQKILELARSPLLLVGGLMQYTESNLGIPEERYEYLARIAKWLISDWAIAQALPPDPLRATYDRIIPKLAYQLHFSQVSECDVSHAQRLIGDWLPDYGFSNSEAAQVLDGILTRTGILVRDISGAVVFAQHSLQEYFASTRLVGSVGAEKLADLSPANWWREPILLAVAQEKEPTACLEALFEKNPLLAAAAVGECPTPSLAAQERAARLALEVIDRSEEGSAASVVPLLRKLTPDLERQLSVGLESRLTAGTPVGPMVANIMATAGSAGATEGLARHSEVWEKVLESTSYLSASFESLLVEWIRGETEERAEKAVDLLSGRLSRDRFTQLVDLLPDLTEPRRSYLAIRLLRSAEQRGNPWFDDPERGQLVDISRCVVHVSDSGEYMKRYKEDPQAASDGSPVPACLYIKSKRIRNSQQRMLSLLTNSFAWTRQRPVMLAWIASCLIVLCVVFVAPTNLLLFSAGFVLFLVAVILPSGLPAWVVGVRYRGISRPLSVIAFHFAGILFYVGVFAPRAGNLAVSAIAPAVAYALSMVLLVAGWAASNERWYRRIVEQLPGHGSFRRWVFLAWVGLLLWMIGARFAVRAIPGPDSYEFVAPLIFLCWVLFETGRLGAASGRLRSAAKRAAKEYPMIEAGFEIPL